jgi:glycosyltransferase involved in cell wall biosynthesis
MKVGIYNRWLPTLGGGEKHSLAVAEYLSRRHQVMVMSHQEVSKGVASDRLKLDLSGVDFCVIPEYSSDELGKISGGFDLFINASFMSYFPAQARVNIFLVYFPSPIKGDFFQRFRRKMGFSLKSFFMIPTFEKSLFQVQLQGHTCLFKTDVFTTLWLHRSRIPYSIKFRLSAGHPSISGVSFLLEDRLIQSVPLEKPGRFIQVELPVPSGRRANPLKLILQAEMDQDFPDMQLRCLILSDLKITHPHFRFFPWVLFKYASGVMPRLYNMRPQPQSLTSILSTYHRIWANSQFTQKWINKYWARESEILYPPVDVDELVPLPKRNQILNVGRFFAAGHNKKHLEMISAFKEMVNEGLKGWEFHLAGGTAPDPLHQDYLRRVLRAARDYPIIIHPDIPFPELVKLYGESTLYWHASGYRENEDRDPHKFEHFGITTVEAMAAGCVPIVIGKGGQPEIVRHGENGFLWQTLGELKKNSWELIQDVSLSRRLSSQAVEDSRRFDRAHFQVTLNRLISSVLTNQRFK